MSQEQEKKPPRFESFATATGFMSDAEMDRLVAEHAPLVGEGKLGAGDANAAIRRSPVHFLGMEAKYRWLYERVWAAAQ